MRAQKAKDYLEKHDHADLQQGMYFVSEIMEAYHQSRVDGITDEEIDVTFPTVPNDILSAIRIGERKGAKWLKEKLKQP